MCVLDIDATSLIIPCILILQEEYFLHHPAGINPVLLNDVVFSVNAAIAQTITVVQCFILKVSPVLVAFKCDPMLNETFLMLLLCTHSTNMDECLQVCSFLYTLL